MLCAILPRTTDNLLFTAHVGDLFHKRRFAFGKSSDDFRCGSTYSNVRVSQTFCDLRSEGSRNVFPKLTQGLDRSFAHIAIEVFEELHNLLPPVGIS